MIGFIALCCNAPKETPQLVGAYKQLSASYKGNGEDTTVVTQQLKIYTTDFMMYADFSPDSVASFGFGTYSAEPGVIKENVSYTSSDTSSNSTLRSYTLDIERTSVGYKQVIPEIGDSIKYQLTEDYERVSKEQTSPLDGAWQLASFRIIQKNDTIKFEGIAYKVYQAGNFMFGNTSTDSTNVKHTGVGFGTFEYISDTQVKETVVVSSYKNVVGKTVDVSIAFSGPDEFTQVITFENGAKYIEVYKKITK